MTIKKEKIANHSGNLGEFSKWIERQREEGRNLAAVSRDFFRMQRRRRPHRRGDFRNSNILAGEHRSYPRNPAGFAREDDLPSLVKTIEGGKRAARRKEEGASHRRTKKNRFLEEWRPPADEFEQQFLRGGGGATPRMCIMHFRGNPF